MKPMETTRVRCPVCGRSVAAYVPKDGDGSAVRIVKHNGITRVKRVCKGWRMFVGATTGNHARGKTTGSNDEG